MASQGSDGRRDGINDKRMIVADISGRHYNRDADVVSVLQKLKAQLGGEIANDE